MKPMSFTAVCLLLFINPGLAQTVSPPATAVPSASETVANPAFSVLPGRWVRVQGGYVITINSVDAEAGLTPVMPTQGRCLFTGLLPPATAAV
jgi:hypothetical protein